MLVYASITSNNTNASVNIIAINASIDKRYHHKGNSSSTAQRLCFRTPNERNHLYLEERLSYIPFVWQYLLCDSH